MIEELKIRDEEVFLLGLCRLEFVVELKVRLLSLAERPLDWKYFTLLANSHGVAALVYNNLEKLNLIHFVPHDQQNFLKNALMMSLSRNTFNTQSMGEVLRLLNGEKIKTVLLKGMALENSVYGNAGLAEILARRLEPLRDLWGISFPAWINEFIDKWHNSGSIDKFIFFLKSPKDNPPADQANSYRHAVTEIPGFHRKLLFVIGDIFPSLSFMKKRYGSTSSWKVLIYYPHRFGKLWWLVKKIHH